MSILILASAVAARHRTRRDAPDPVLARFSAHLRPAIAALCERGPALRDLAVSFPGLLHRIAVRPRDQACALACALVLDGVPLKSIAAVAGLPFWTRRLPPEAFGRVSPELPGGEAFARRVGNVLPRAPKSAAGWLSCVAEAARWGDDDFVLWVAREHAATPREFPVNRLPLLALHAWYSARPDSLGGGVADQRWSPRLSAEAALARARNWLDSVEICLFLGAKTIDPWLAPGRIDGYDFAPLVTAHDLLGEARSMRNCVKTYGCAIGHGWERVWSVRREGRRVATVAVHFTDDDAPFPQISELKGRGNAAAPPEVWFAARRWLGSQTPTRQTQIPYDADAIDPAAWRAMWRPYWLDRRRIPEGLPVKASNDVLYALKRGGPRRLARRRRRA